MSARYECDLCGLCCKKLIIEIGQLDVVREPRLLASARLMDGNGAVRYESDWDKEYLLACGDTFPCAQLGEDNRCGVYPTRPNCCVAFEAGSEQCREVREGAGLAPLLPVPPEAREAL